MDPIYAIFRYNCIPRTVSESHFGEGKVSAQALPALDDLMGEPIFEEDDRFAETAADIGRYKVKKMLNG